MPPTQTERPFSVLTALGKDELLVDSFVATERISEPFRFVLRLLSPNPNVDMKALLTKPLRLTLRLNDGSERYIHGHICRMRLLELNQDGMAAYQAEVVPWLWFLNLFSNCRIFYQKSVPDIVMQVFRDRGFTAYTSQVRGTYPAREYCVQYNETDFNFVSRLLEEEGIFYYFRQEESGHTLVLGDSAAAFSPCPNMPEANFLASTGSRQSSDTVETLDQEYTVHAASASVDDYDFQKPYTDLRATLAPGGPGELYYYPGGYSSKDEGDRYARLRLEEQAARALIARGKGNCMGFECGYKFKLQEHYRDDANQEYVIIGLQQKARNTSYRAGQTDPFEYSNHFEAIPASTPFRPQRRARKPRIEGTQTAVVMGPSGQEIYTDEYGSVKVKFHWDRQGERDGANACWVRVAQNWAGKHWGALFTPRIGQEVVVTFLEGDPDRPLITGGVYNADQEIPYDQSDNKTRSTLKSMSSEGGEGFNEIRFEDKKGSEQIFLHAEKDLDARIKNDRKDWIGQDQHCIIVQDQITKTGRDHQGQIGRNENRKVGQDSQLEIGGNNAIKVTGTRSLAVTGNVAEEFKANYSCQVTANAYLKGQQVVIEAESGMTLKVGGNFITLSPAGVAIQGSLIQLNSAGVALPGVPGMVQSPTAPTDATKADDAQPGEVTSVHEKSPVPLTKMTLGTLQDEAD